jgi:hypothetical protein
MAIRVRLFIDFWNLQLNWNNFHWKIGATAIVPIPWKELSQLLCSEIGQGQPVKFTGTRVYASIDPSNPKDKKLTTWLHHTLASFTGYSIEVKERKPRKAIHCQDENCRALIKICPECKTPLKGTVEKGIDAAIITDLLSMAFDDNYDIGVLISGDADFAPAVEYIQKKTDKQIVQAFFKAHGDQLRNACWSHVFFDDLMPKLIGGLPVEKSQPKITRPARPSVSIPDAFDQSDD